MNSLNAAVSVAVVGAVLGGVVLQASENSRFVTHHRQITELGKSVSVAAQELPRFMELDGGKAGTLTLSAAALSRMSCDVVRKECLAHPASFTSESVDMAARILVCPVVAPASGTAALGTARDLGGGRVGVQGVRELTSTSPAMLLALIDPAQPYSTCEQLYDRAVVKGEAAQMPGLRVVTMADWAVRRQGQAATDVVRQGETAPAGGKGDLLMVEQSPGVFAPAVQTSDGVAILSTSGPTALVGSGLYGANACPSGMVRVASRTLFTPLTKAAAQGTPPDSLTAKTAPAGWQATTVPSYCLDDREVALKSDNPTMSVSVGTGQGLVPASVSQVQATQLCEARGLSLPTDLQWRSLAFELASVEGNWTGGSVGQGSLFQGHSQGSPSRALATGLLTEKTAGIDGPGPASSRVMRLSSGAPVWDVAGNLPEWVDWRVSPRAWNNWVDGAAYSQGESGECRFEGNCSAQRLGNGSVGVLSTVAALPFEVVPRLPGSPATVLTSAAGAGSLVRWPFAFAGTSAEALPYPVNNQRGADPTSRDGSTAWAAAALRGGGYLSGSHAGVYALDVRFGAGFKGEGSGPASPAAGFRCVRSN